MSFVSQIESLLFITNQPFTVKKLAEILKTETKEVEAALVQLLAKYNTEGSGINIQRIDGRVQMVTAPSNAKVAGDFAKAEMTGELTRAALETLTIVAYRGPITRAEIEKIRGVNCAVILRNLQVRGLVDSVEDKKKMQHTYNITFEFLQHLGVNTQSELPDYQMLSTLEAIDQVLGDEQEEKRVQ